MGKEKYEKLYKEHECVFGLKPTPIVEKMMKYLASGRVIDLGAGEGRNSLFLAKKGFEATAIDNSKTAIDKLRKFTQEKKISVNTILGDIREFDIPQKQDAILAMLIFHHFSRPETILLIKKMKLATREGGLNVLNVITKEGDFYRNNPNTDRFYAEQDEIKKIYQDWEILEFDRRTWEAFQKRPDGSPMFNTSEEIIVRKLRD